jgi:hypothetical protein
MGEYGTVHGQRLPLAPVTPVLVHHRILYDPHVQGIARLWRWHRQQPVRSRVCMFSGQAIYVDAALMTMLRTPYRIDIVQPVYFVINSFDDLPKLLNTDLKAAIDTAKELGDLPPQFENAINNPSVKTLRPTEPQQHVSAPL